MGKKILVTGTTGFIGQNFIHQDLQKTDNEYFLLTRDSKDTPYDSRIQLIDAERKRITFVKGDVTNSNLTENYEVHKQIKKDIDEIVHFAASVDFSENKSESTHQINDKGTRNLLNFAKECDKLDVANIISTFYVCGKLSNPEKCLEELASADREYKNPYEKSKSKAELMVVNSGVPYKIFRPSIVVGTKNGEYFDNKTIYGLFLYLHMGKMMYHKNNNIPGNIFAKTDMGITIIGNPDAGKNVINVDVANDMIIRLMRYGAKNKIYNICSPENTPLDNMVKGATDFMNINRVTYLSDKDSKPHLSSSENLVLKAFKGYSDYMLADDPIPDMTNTKEVLGQSYLDRMPKLDKAFFRHKYEIFFKNFFQN